MSNVAIPGYYDMERTAEIRGVAYSTVTRWVRAGLFPPEAVLRLGRRVLLEQGAVHRFVPPEPGNPALLALRNSK